MAISINIESAILSDGKLTVLLEGGQSWVMDYPPQENEISQLQSEVQGIAPRIAALFVAVNLGNASSLNGKSIVADFASPSAMLRLEETN